jgi:putative Mg2+ transporter-C (MgtC) family protein
LAAARPAGPLDQHRGATAGRPADPDAPDHRACLFTLISAYGFGGGIGTDPSRLAAQIVTGIGFLGGGAIVRHGLTVKGLTTAASIWATASVGVAIGAGSYVLGIGGAVLVVGTLFGLRRVSGVLQRWEH